MTTRHARSAPAAPLVPGTVLHTRDGRRIGNAVVLEVVPDEGHGPVYGLQTDFGNRLLMTGAEVRGAFRVGPAGSLDRRARDQADLLAGRRPEIVPDDHPPVARGDGR